MATTASTLSTGQGNFGYNAFGTIQDSPRVYLIFWGNNWNTDSSGIHASVVSLFEALGGTDYNRILSEYSDTLLYDYIHNDTTLAGVWTDPNGPSGTVTAYHQASGPSLQDEILNAASVNGWPNDYNAQYLVFTQSGTTVSNPNGWCGNHYYYNPNPGYEDGYTFAWIPYMGDYPFSSQCTGYGPSLAARATTVASHEYAESATDGQFNAWNGSGGEVGDLCTAQYFTLPGTNIYVQRLWDIALDSCNSSNTWDAKVARVRDADPVLSAVRFSKAWWATPGSGLGPAPDRVVIVRSSDPGWVDGIPGAGLARGHGPLLYADSSSTSCTSADDTALFNEIKRLNNTGSVGTAYIIGGTAGVPSCVDSKIQGLKIYPQRVSGPERCASAVSIANLIGPDQAVNLVSGDTYADGISMASVNDVDHLATLVAPSYSGGAAPSLCSQADTFLQAFGNSVRSWGGTPIVRIAGGTAAVSTSVETEVNRDVCPATLNCTVRYAGSDRYHTSLLIASNLEPSPTNFTITTGQGWTDGVPGGVFANEVGSAILLVDTNQYATQTYISANMLAPPDHHPSLGYVLGSTSSEPAGNVQYFAGLFPTPALGGPIRNFGDQSLCVDDRSSKAVAGNPVQIYGCNDSGAQAWTLESNGELVVLGGCLDTQGGGTANGTYVVWNNCTGAATQTWVAGIDGRIYNPASGRCLDDPGDTTNWGTQMWIYNCNQQSYAQDWMLP
jgi:hypothetical protein